MDPLTLENLSLLLMRVALSLPFFSSGWSHARDPAGRGESIGMSAPVTFGLGALELVAALSVSLGLFPRAGAMMIGFVMIGAIYKKAFVWKTGFFGEENGGWYYDLLYVSAALVVLATGGGAWVVY